MVEKGRSLEVWDNEESRDALHSEVLRKNREGLAYKTESTGILREVLDLEREKILGYLSLNKRLPLGNKIVR